MSSIISASWTLLAGVVVLFLPGLAWQAFFWDPEQDTFERIAELIGQSIALSAVAALFAYLLGLHLSSSGLFVIYALMALPAFWTIRRWWRKKFWGINNTEDYGYDIANHQKPIDQKGQETFQLQAKLLFLTLALVFLVVVVWRFYQIQSVVLPLWVDSVHHVQVVISFLEKGAIPETLEPQVPVPFYYHYAFHVVAALFSFFARQSPPDAVLYLGQVLNAAVSFSVYRLGKALWGDWRRAVMAALLVAFVTQMPAYYVTWGRYTLLTGMVLLPLVMAVALDIVNKGVEKSRLFTLSLLIAGISLTHYFAAALTAIFLFLIGLQVLIRNIRSKSKSVWNTWLPMLLAALLGLLAASPWLYRMWSFAQGRINVVAIQPNLEAIEAQYFPDYLTYLWRLLGPTRNHAILFAALPGLVIALLHKRTRVFGFWTIILAVLSLPVGFYLAPFRPDHAVIVLFLPTALLVAELFVSVIDWIPIWRIATIQIVAALMIFAAIIGWGMFETRSVINSSTILATRDDLDALYWIKENTPPESRYMINVTHWQYGSYRGVDGGWWITPITGRETLLPNGLYGLGDRETLQAVNAVAGRASQLAGCSEDFWQIVETEALTHLYITVNKGSIQPRQLENCPGVELIFHNESVYLYRIEYIIIQD